jgi:hypothetical protein
MPRARAVVVCGGAQPGQVAQRFMGRIRDPHGGEFSAAEQSRD